MDPELQMLTKTLPLVVRSALASSTTGKYEQGWKSWQVWIKDKPEICVWPADPFHVSLFFTHLLHSRGTRGAITTAAYGINWAHRVMGVRSPLLDPFVQLVLKGCERLTSKPTKKKDPLTTPMIKELVDMYRADIDACSVSSSLPFSDLLDFFGSTSYCKHK